MLSSRIYVLTKVRLHLTQCTAGVTVKKMFCRHICCCG